MFLVFNHFVGKKDDDEAYLLEFRRVCDEEKSIAVVFLSTQEVEIW